MWTFYVNRLAMRLTSLRVIVARISFLIILHFLTTATPSCPPSGSLVPRPTSLSTSAPVQRALVNLTDTFNAVLAGKIEADWHVPNSSFSLVFVSLDDPFPNHPTWEFHHRGSANPRSIDVVDGESQYLIGSVSKLLFNVLVWRIMVDVDRPITHWITELA